MERGLFEGLSMRAGTEAYPHLNGILLNYGLLTVVFDTGAFHGA
jgi:hypothetical protein